MRLFTGLGAGNISTIQGYVADVTPPAERAARMGLIGAAFGLGFIVGPGIGGLLAREDSALGYQLPIFTAAGLAALAAVGVVLFLRESREKADPATPRPPFLSGLHDARRNPVVSRVLLVTLIYMAGFSGMESTFGLWTEARYGWGAREVGLSFMIIGIISALNQGIFTGKLARQFGEGAGAGRRHAAVRGFADRPDPDPGQLDAGLRLQSAGCSASGPSATAGWCRGHGVRGLRHERWPCPTSPPSSPAQSTRSGRARCWG